MTKDHDPESRPHNESLYPPPTTPWLQELSSQRPEEPSPPDPFSRGELCTAFLRPHRSIELVLAKWRRLASSIAEKHRLGLLVGLLLAVSVIAALPYGAVIGVDRLWRVSAFFLGSVLICFPSLHVFGAFLGFRSNIGQNLALALVISAVAALFSLSFAPILWFLATTMPDGASTSVLQGISVILLLTGVVAGMIQLGRCLYVERRLRSGGADSLLIVLWQVLLLFITCRMGVFLGLI